jgi:hypothetical protein
MFPEESNAIVCGVSNWPSLVPFEPIFETKEYFSESMPKTMLVSVAFSK